MEPDDEEQAMIQQDLIGFFNSVLHARICSALQLMTYRLQERFGQPIEDLTFQVDHKTGARGLRICKGQRRFRGSNTKVLRIQHVMQLTEFLLQSAYFNVGMQTTDAFSCVVPSCKQNGQICSFDWTSTVCPLSLNRSSRLLDSGPRRARAGVSKDLAREVLLSLHAEQAARREVGRQQGGELAQRCKDSDFSHCRPVVESRWRRQKSRSCSEPPERESSDRLILEKLQDVEPQLAIAPNRTCNRLKPAR
eukprot:s9138_g2.t2